MVARYHIEAVITDRRGRIIASAGNSYEKTHPIQKKYAIMAGCPKREFLHAEIRAIIKALKITKELWKIAISRTDCMGNTRLAKPCKICELAIKEAGIQRIEYTA
jgi:tRNA(Arg) A34 adenosine deaminase TadA